MTTRVRLLCHASTTAVRTSTFPADEEIDAQGRQKLNGLSRHLRHWDRCITSPARRATQTAAALDLQATIEPMLRDCDYGRWTGRPFDEVQAQEPEALADWIKDPSAAPHGGESVVAMIARVSAWLDTQLTTPGVILAITHAPVIRAAIVCAIEAEARSFWHVDIAPLSLTQFSGNGGRWTLVSMSSGKADSITDSFQ
jgi:broad specificity phosphatase PhoE